MAERDQSGLRTAAARLLDQLDRQPRCPSGGYWHKRIYPDQMWLDGLYIDQPMTLVVAALAKLVLFDLSSLDGMARALSEQSPREMLHGAEAKEAFSAFFDRRACHAEHCLRPFPLRHHSSQ